ncbi:hypothetical protein GCM10010425_04520 [Streptomyces spororaveus]
MGRALGRPTGGLTITARGPGDAEGPTWNTERFGQRGPARTAPEGGEWGPE